MKRQVTNGEFHVDFCEGVDEKEGAVYFTANGVNKDPYYAHFYKVNLNGIGFKSLNPGNYNMYTYLSDTHKYFVSNYSRVNTVPKSELRSASGALIMNLEEADLSQLFATGSKFPEPFKMKAADGITDLYANTFDFKLLTSV